MGSTHPYANTQGFQFMHEIFSTLVTWLVDFTELMEQRYIDAILDFKGNWLHEDVLSF